MVRVSRTRDGHVRGNQSILVRSPYGYPHLDAPYAFRANCTS